MTAAWSKQKEEPYLKDRYTEVCGAGCIAAIARGYFTDKYTKFGKHYIDLTCWCEDIEGRIWCEGYGSIELPSRADWRLTLL